MPPTVDCRPLPPFASHDLEGVRAAFAAARPIPLGQAWLAAPEHDFAPGIVRTGWRENSLLVFADLADADVFTLAKRHNDRFWELGDTFEMFLQPPGQDGYVELHVAPNNLRLQLRFAKPPSARDADPFTSALIHDQAFDSRTWLKPATRGWCVFAEIPLMTLIERQQLGPAPVLSSSTWRFSFSRYDATRGREHPVISSSSPHTKPAFHRPNEWGHIYFAF
ncbi:MAG TPA: carbohydrate-binding family 9-like protein [Vicinamibacterales bacterium]|nr:carbohydrate-binding family 9-like protein [Vicinamibacterales bacterium]